MNRIKATMMAIGGVALAVNTFANDGVAGLLEADYEIFANVGVLDPDVSNAEANELVLRGIASSHPRIVELAVRGMGEEAFRRSMHEAVVARTFSQVAGLKEFLIGYWDDNVADFKGGVEFVPMILAVHFAGDEDAYRLIWDYHAQGGSDFATLLALNAGRFMTPEADKLRIDSLSSDDFLTVAAGARGIAMSKPRGGLDAVVSSLKSNPLGTKMPAIEDAIVAYGSEAIPKLRDMLEHRDVLAPAIVSTLSAGLGRIVDAHPSER